MELNKEALRWAARIAIERLGLDEAPKQTITPRLYTPNGERECARRQRQIALGQLRRENGLAA